MRGILILLVTLVLVSGVSFANNFSTEGGNVTEVDSNGSMDTSKWAGIVGWMNTTAPSNVNNSISERNITNPIIYTQYPNGTYTNYTMVVTRLGFKPNITDVSSPVASDFNETGMFSTFNVFSGVNFSRITDDPLQTFCNPCSYMDCFLTTAPTPCPYITIDNDTKVGVLKFDNGTHEEPLFVTVIENQLGYNGTYFDFQYLIPALEDYFFYVYPPAECNITIWIDNVETTVFPNTGTPYGVRFLVTDDLGVPIPDINLTVVEINGRSIIHPILSLGKSSSGLATMTTDASGEAVYALAPTRYNIPDNFGYIMYAVVEQPYYCQENFTIANYGSLTPTYRTSLINADYESQVKSSVQNMNSLTSTAGKWLNARKMRNATFNVNTTGTSDPVPQLKAGAPNYINITVNESAVVANITSQETDGFIIMVPSQPDKEIYNSSVSYNSSEALLVIPTRYNNNANLTLFLNYGGDNFINISFSVDSVLEEPGGGEADIDDVTYAQISSALQNIILVLSNIGKSISTV